MLKEIAEPDPPPSFQLVHIWTGTWNMGNAAPDPEQLRHWFGLDSGSHDLYAVGLQESSFSMSPEMKRVGNTLTAYLAAVFAAVLGPEYTVVETRTMWEIRLILLVREETRPPPP